MTAEQQRKMLEAAAKACGMWECRMPVASKADGAFYMYVKRTYWVNGRERHEYWNPLANPADTAEMCAELGICTLFFYSEQKVSCGFLAQDKGPTLAHIEPYGDSRLKAWMHAATMVAARIGGYKE